MPDKVAAIGIDICQYVRAHIEKFLNEKELSLQAMLNAEEADREAELVMVAVAVNYDHHKDFFDTSLDWW